MHELNEWRDVGPLHILETTLDNEMKEVDFNIIPSLYEKHWTLVIVCGLGPRRDANLFGVPWITLCILHLNSLQNHGIEKCHGYAITKVVSRMTRIKANHVAWHEIWSPKKLNGLDDGFYVMRIVVEFLKNTNSHYPLLVHILFHILEYSSFGEIKPKFAPKARRQLRGFIGSLNRDERDWMT